VRPSRPHMHCGPPPGPVGHHLAGTGDTRIVTGARPHLAIGVGVAQPELVPAQPGWPTEAWQVSEDHLVTILELRTAGAEG
jgi:hypothetical protein